MNYLHGRGPSVYLAYCKTFCVDYFFQVNIFIFIFHPHAFVSLITWLFLYRGRQNLFAFLLNSNRPMITQIAIISNQISILEPVLQPLQHNYLIQPTVSCRLLGVPGGWVFSSPLRLFLFSADDPEIQHCEDAPRGHTVSSMDFNTLRPRQMAVIFQTTFSNAFSWVKMC